MLEKGIPVLLKRFTISPRVWLFLTGADYFLSIEIVIIKENFIIIKKEAVIESCIKQVFFKKLFFNEAALHSKNVLKNKITVKMFILVLMQASYLQIY